jgi:hypothetical protein
MARIHHARPQQQVASRSMALEKSRAAVKKKKPYKIVLEAVTQEKKKLHSIVRRHLVVPCVSSTDTHLANVRLKCTSRVWLCSRRTS